MTPTPCCIVAKYPRLLLDVPSLKSGLLHRPKAGSEPVTTYVLGLAALIDDEQGEILRRMLPQTALTDLGTTPEGRLIAGMPSDLARRVLVEIAAANDNGHGQSRNIRPKHPPPLHERMDLRRK